MKKIGALILFSLLLVSFISIALIKAEIMNNSGVPAEAQKISDIGGKISKQNVSAQYLKQEWNKILLKNKYVAPVIKVIDAIFTFLNPLFKPILGVEYSFSLAFILALVIWIVLFIFMFQPAKAIFSDKASFALIASFAITSLIGLSGTIKYFVDLISTVITSTIIFWISVAITILISILIIHFGGGLKQLIEQERAKATKDQTEKDRKIIHIDAEISKKQLDSYKE
jgi:hypothetical protein